MKAKRWGRAQYLRKRRAALLMWERHCGAWRRWGEAGAIMAEMG